MEANGEIKSGAMVETTQKINIPTAKLAELNLTDYMRDSIDKVALAEGFRNYEININHGSSVGDGFVGVMVKATIQEKDSDKKLSIVLKMPPKNQAVRKDFGAMDLFKREVYIYNEVFPEFMKFQREEGIKENEGFHEIPKCYFAEFNEEKDDSIIIMADLREAGFTLWDKTVPTNFEHAQLVVAALGRFHAVSFAMKAKKPDVFEKFTKLNDFMSEKMLDTTFGVMMKTNVEKAVDLFESSDTENRKRVARLSSDFNNDFKSLLDAKLSEPFNVITHGDCWSNNFMYSYEEGFLDKIVLLDWQIARYCSPVLDLVYFIFVCTDAAMREKHYDELLKIYHNSLKELLDRLGGDTQTQFPFSDFLKHLKRYGKFGIIMASSIVPMMGTKNDELPDIGFMAENNKNDDPEITAQLVKSFGAGNDSFKPRLLENLLDAIRYGYL